MPEVDKKGGYQNTAIVIGGHILPSEIGLTDLSNVGSGIAVFSLFKSKFLDWSQIRPSR